MWVVGSQGKISRIVTLSLLVLSSPLILTWIVVQVPFSVVEHAAMRRREKRFAIRMGAAGRLIAWAEARSQIDNQHGTLIGESVAHDAYRLWWTAEDIPAISPYPCCFEGNKPPEPWEHIVFDDWCRSRFTNPASGTARLVDIQRADQEWLDYLLTAGNRYVRVHRAGRDDRFCPV